VLEGLSDMTGSNRTFSGLTTVLVLIVLIGGAALLYANREAGGKASDTAQVSQYAKGSLSALQIPDPVPAPDYVFKDAEGGDVRFADFAGKVTLVNLWATWCAPCKIEMPTLAALADSYKDRPDFAVVAISADVEKAVPDARTFISENAPLAFYSDPKFQLPFELPGKGAMPQTLILDRKGQIRAVLVGEADWNSLEAKALVDSLLAE
jgi:thiol-disulfide isomerase/thioredoxin